MWCLDCRRQLEAGPQSGSLIFRREHESLGIPNCSELYFLRIIKLYSHVSVRVCDIPSLSVTDKRLDLHLYGHGHQNILLTVVFNFQWQSHVLSTHLRIIDDEFLPFYGCANYIADLDALFISFWLENGWYFLGLARKCQESWYCTIMYEFTFTDRTWKEVLIT